MNQSKAGSVESTVDVQSGKPLNVNMKSVQFKQGHFTRPSMQMVISDIWMWRKPALILLGTLDLLSIFVSAYIAFVTVLGFDRMISLSISWTFTAALACVFYPLISIVCGLFDRYNSSSWESIIVRCALASGLIWAFAVLLIYSWVFTPPGRTVVFVGFLSLTFFFATSRLIVLSLGSVSPIRVLFIGSEDVQKTLCDELDSAGIEAFQVVDVGDDETFKSRIVHDKNPDSISLICRQEFINLVIFQDASQKNLMTQIVRLLKRGIKIDNLVGFFEEVFFKTPVDFVDTSWLINADKQVLRHSYRAIKRALDIIVSVTAIIVTFPLWCIIAAIIKLTDRGPVFYSQIRVGRGGTHFKIFKFRTMVYGCEQICGPQWASCNDARITGIGKILRRTRLDELPQFWNVLQGHMSVVGPRPERPEFVSSLERNIPNYDLRHLVRPGLTGWAQINFPYASSESDSKEKVCYDLYYVKYGGFLLDLYILVRTIGVLMQGSR